MAGHCHVFLDLIELVNLHYPEGIFLAVDDPLFQFRIDGPGHWGGIGAQGLPDGLVQGGCHYSDFHALDIFRAFNRFFVVGEIPESVFGETDALKPEVSRLLNISEPRGPSRILSAWALSLNKKG